MFNYNKYQKVKLNYVYKQIFLKKKKYLLFL